MLIVASASREATGARRRDAWFKGKRSVLPCVPVAIQDLKERTS